MSKHRVVVPAALLLAVVVAGCRNHPPAAPAEPTGPPAARRGSNCSFYTLAFDPDADSVSLRFDWADGDTSPWGNWLAPGMPDSAAHAWPRESTYRVRAQAKDAHDALSPWSPVAEVLVNDTLNHSPGVVGVTGPDSGFIGIPYEFRARAADPDGDDLLIRLACSHGDTTVWRTLPDSGRVFTDSWTTAGPHLLVAQAKDEYGALSAWSQPWSINISTEGTLGWRYPAYLSGFDSPAVGSDGTIYVASWVDGLHAVNPDGSTRWLKAMEVSSAPAIGPNECVFVGGADSAGHALFAFRPDGTMKWRFAVAADIEGAAAISTDGVIYFGCEDSLLYAVDTGGTLRWRHRFSHGLWTRCAIGPDGTVYCDDGCDSLFALQPDGTVKWSVKATGFAGIAIGADGTIYCSTTEDGRNYMCAWAPDGSERWRCECGTWSWNSPAIGSDGTIYFGAREGIFAIAPEGTRKWMYRTGHIASTAAVRADSVVCVGSVDGCFYALNPDGTLRWRLRVLDAGIYEVPTVITQDGTILFVSDGHVLNAVHGTSPLADSPWPKFQRDLANSGRAGGR